MPLHGRSFKVGIIAGVFLIAGLIGGIVISSRMDWLPSADSAETAVEPQTPVMNGPATNFVPVVNAVAPAVVNIATKRVMRAGRSGQGAIPDDPFFREFFGEEFFKRFQMPRDRRENSLGSGVIVDPSGLIITNNHVIAKADEIKVLLRDKREFIGKVVGTDPKTDLAIIKIDAKDLPVVLWGDSDKLQVGEYVLAIGNPFALSSTVTMGIVSAVGRANVGIADYEDFIQTDAAINPGNSGGALVNARGELVGINTAIFSRSGGYMGIGFAVPANMTRAVMDSLVKSGKVTRGWLGVSIQEVNQALAKQFGLSEATGALVGDVMTSSPAAATGLKSGDVIVSYDGRAVDGPTGLRNMVAQTPVGRSVKVEVLRGKKRQTFKVKIAEQPADMGQSDEGDAVEEEDDASAFSGLELRNLTAEVARQLGIASGTQGVVVTSVAPDSTAAEAGVQPGDVILEIDREPVRSVADVKRISGKLAKGEGALLYLNRRGGKLFVALKPE